MKKFGLEKATVKRTPVVTQFKVSEDSVEEKVDESQYRTVEFGLWYSFDTTSVFVGYYDVDWAGCAEDRKSTSGGCFFLGNNLIP